MKLEEKIGETNEEAVDHVWQDDTYDSVTHTVFAQLINEKQMEDRDSHKDSTTTKLHGRFVAERSATPLYSLFEL